MCWGSVQWSRLNKVYIGADRFTAAKYGFDDKVFYDEVENHAETFGLHRYGFIPDSNAQGESAKESRVHKNMMEVHVGILSEEVEPLFTNTNVNKTGRRKLGSGTALRDMYKDAFQDRPLLMKNAPQDAANHLDRPPAEMPSLSGDTAVPLEKKQEFMREAVRVATAAAKKGTSKEREPFGAVMVHDGKVIARSTNSVLQTRDATATAEVNVIRAAAAALGKYDLQDCTLYTTTVPDVMSMSACLWARIPQVYAGVSQEFALRHGHEEGWLHFQELMTGSPKDRAIRAVDDVAKPVCENVFKFWSSLNGVVY